MARHKLDKHLSPADKIPARTWRKEAVNYLTEAKPAYDRYIIIRKTARAKVKRRRTLQKELDATPILNIPKRRELSVQIIALTEAVEELHSEEKALMRRFDKTDAEGMKQVQQEITNTEANMQRMDDHRERMTEDIRQAKQKYEELRNQAADLNQGKLIDENEASREP